MPVSDRQRRHRTRLLPAFALVVLFLGTCRADWTLDVFAGSALNIWTPLRIHQDGLPDIALNSRCTTRPFEEVPYYDVRIGADLGRARWELELVHHKLYLEDRPSEVQRFEITHGFNLITLNRRWLFFGFGLRTGAGIVLAHPQTTIRGRAFPENGGAFGLGWYVSGGAAQVGLEQRIRLNSRFDAGLEAKFTAAAARAPIAGGYVDVANLALHGLAGLRYHF
jgi:hypothetical protein